MAKRDYYEVLGVDRTATPDDLKRAYRKVAMQLHPDRNPGDSKAEDGFKEASEAYAVLSDAEKRRRYDRMGHAGFGGDGGGAPGGFDPADLGAMGDLLEGLGDILRGARPKRAPRPGRDIKVELQVTFEEAALGTEKTIQVSRPVDCGTCGGSGCAPGTLPEVCLACGGRGEVRFQRGFFASARTCQTCNGTGKRIVTPCPTCSGAGAVPKTEALLVRLPAGVEDGAVRTVRGGGERGPGGPGDLHVEVKIQPHPLYTRSGADVSCTIPVSFPQAALGAQIDIPTLEGRVKMRLPPGTPSGKVFRLRGKGIAVFGGVGKGDQLVRIEVEVPETLTPRQRELLEQLAAEMGEGSLPERQSFLDKLKSLFD